MKKHLHPDVVIALHFVALLMGFCLMFSPTPVLFDLLRDLSR